MTQMKNSSAGEPIVLGREHSPALPQIISGAEPGATKRFWEFFAVNIRNVHTRRAYGRAVFLFMTWCEEKGATALSQISPMLVAAYIEQRTREREPQTVKQDLAAIRMLFDWLVVGQVIPHNL